MRVPGGRRRAPLRGGVRLRPGPPLELVTGAAVGDTGWRPEEVLGRTIFELVPPEPVERYAGPSRTALAGQRQRFDVDGWRDPAGAWAAAVVLVRGAGGVITGGIVFACDVTEPCRTERELRKRRRQRLGRVVPGGRCPP